MSDLVPFITSKNDKSNAQKFYSDAKYARVSAPSYKIHKHGLPEGVPVWIDTGVEGFFNSSPTDDWVNFIKQFAHADVLLSGDLINRPKKNQIEEFVSDVMKFCQKKKPAAISVPQIPIQGKSDYNKINRELAKATGKWRAESSYDGRLILPVIATNQKQLNNKTDRNRVVGQAKANLAHSAATGIWAVDQSLFDQSATGTFKARRFPALVDFYTELKEATPEASLRFGGPYWGLGYLMWARGLIDSICVGVGKSYQYFITGTPISGSSNTRIAIPPLYRWAIAGTPLADWISKATKAVDEHSVFHQQFQELFKQLETIQTNDTASRRQIAEFHRAWYDSLESVEPTGRQILLFQQLSGAYVLGKKLKRIPTETGRLADPSNIAEDFMLNCL